MQSRETARHNWLKSQLNHASFTITPLAGDASFRRYFRLQTKNSVQILMDAPPHQEAIDAFLYMASWLAEQGIRVPRIDAVDFNQGFVLLEDFGDALLLHGLTPNNAHKRYVLAMDTLLAIQKITPKNAMDNQVAPFDERFIRSELHLFQTWFLERHLKLSLSTHDTHQLHQTFDWLVCELLNQPQVLVHRDYHSRNIMMLSNETIGIIDFQDAMYGPYAYDLVSLLKDCYVQWPDEQTRTWLANFYQQLPPAHRVNSLDAFQHAFDVCGLQRHLKVLGVFCRLHLRDNKSTYLQDLPLTFNYVLSYLERNPMLHSFYDFMRYTVYPAFVQQHTFV